MSNSTLPLGFFHKTSPTISRLEVVGFYFYVSLSIKLLLVLRLGELQIFATLASKSRGLSQKILKCKNMFHLHILDVID